MNAAYRDIFLVCNLRYRRSTQDQRQSALTFDDILNQRVVNFFGWFAKMQLQFHTPPAHLEPRIYGQCGIVKMLNRAVHEWAMTLGSNGTRNMPGRRSTRLIRELDDLIRRRGQPDMIISENGTEMTSQAVLRWCQDTGVGWH